SAEALRAAGNADAAVIWLGTGERKRGRRFTYGDLYELLPHRNELCVLTVTRDELAKFVTEHDKLVRDRDYPQLLFASGIKIHRAGGGEITRVEAPEKLTLAANDYLIADSSVLRVLAYRGDRNFRRLGVLERDAVAQYLASPKNSKHHDKYKDVVK
ncbi:MAG: 5'-nucleotidase C-terminal domain-containing protein, partial [Lentisphaeria bacterium]|nr:5'-nucleotidase C-terminal domain-containing protein [Lentisphaeria bacterium]